MARIKLEDLDDSHRDRLSEEEMVRVQGGITTRGYDRFHRLTREGSGATAAPAGSFFVPDTGDEVIISF